MERGHIPEAAKATSLPSPDTMRAEIADARRERFERLKTEALEILKEYGSLFERWKEGTLDPAERSRMLALNNRLSELTELAQKEGAL